MALQPIQSFQGAESPIVSLLQAGNATITGILDRAIQQGAQMSDRRMRQEQDLLAMRQQETALAQRRAEGLTRDITDAQRSARRAYEVDRLFDRDVMEKDRSFDRGVMESDRVFKRQGEEFDWRKGITEKGLKRQEDLDVLAQEDRRRRWELETAEEIRRGQAMGLDILKRDEERARSEAAAATLDDLLKRTPKDEREARELAGALTAYNTASTPTEDRARVSAKIANIESDFPAKKDGDKEPTEMDLSRRAARATQVLSEEVNLNPGAFKVSQSYAPEVYVRDGDGKITAKIDPLQLVQREMSALKRAGSRDAYIQAGEPSSSAGKKLTQAEREARGRVYDLFIERERTLGADLLAPASPAATVPDVGAVE
jgi:hypothetical protein